MWTLYLSHLLPDCFQNFLYGFLFIKLSSQFEYGLCPITKMAATCQFALLYTLTVIYHLISSKFHIWTSFIKLLFISKYGFCPMNDNQDCRQNGYPLFTAGHYAAGALCRSPTALVQTSYYARMLITVVYVISCRLLWLQYRLSKMADVRDSK